MEENGCYSCGAETFNACGCEDKDAETYEAQGRTKKKTLIFVDLSGSTMQSVGSNKPLLHSWKDHLDSLEDDAEYTIVGLGSAGGDKLLLKDGTASEVAQLNFPSMGGTKPLTKEIVQKYSNMIGKHNDMIYYTDALEYDGFGLAAETYAAQKRSRYGNRYVSRNSKGRFTKNVSVGRSLSADRRKKSNKRPRHLRQGDQGDYGAEGDFGMVGEGNNFGQNRAETFGAESGEFQTGAMYGAGAVVGITGATMVLGALMSLFSRRS